MSNGIYDEYSENIINIINKYKVLFLGIDNNSINYVYDKFVNNNSYYKLEDIEYAIYSHFSNIERNYINQIEKLKTRIEVSAKEEINVLNLLTNTSNFKNTIYISKKTFDNLFVKNLLGETYKYLKIYINKENMNDFREVLNIDALSGIKFDSTDYVNDDYGLDFYLGNILIRVSVIERKENNIIIKEFVKENYKKSFSISLIEDNKEIFDENSPIKQINIENCKINKFRCSFEELNYIDNRQKLIKELNNQKEKEHNEGLKSRGRRGYISIYYSVIILSWILAGYTIITIIIGGIK